MIKILGTSHLLLPGGGTFRGVGGRKYFLAGGGGGIFTYHENMESVFLPNHYWVETTLARRQKTGLAEIL